MILYILNQFIFMYMYFINLCIFIQFMHYNLRTKQKRPETHHLDAEPFYLKLNDAGS